MTAESNSHTASRMALVKRFAVLLRPYWLHCLGIMLGIFLQVALYLLFPYGFRVMFDRAIPLRDLDLLLKVMAALFALFIVCGSAAVVQYRLIAKVASAVMRDLRLEMFDRLNRLSASYFMKTETSAIIGRFVYDLGAIEVALMRSLPALIECVLVVVACLVAIMMINWHLALVTLLLLPLSFIGGQLLGPKAMALFVNRGKQDAGLIGTLQESLGARPIIRAFGLEAWSRGKFSEASSGVAKSAEKLGFWGAMIPVSSMYGVNFLLVAIVGVSAMLVIDEHLSMGTFFGSFALLLSVAGGTSSGATAYAEFTRMGAAMFRVDTLLRERITVEDRPDAKQLAPLKKVIRLQDVVFGYVSGHPILKGVNLSIPAGSSVAFVGSSGSGKSTILSLLTRIFDPDAGCVTFDGIDARDVTQRSLRAQMGVILQESFLFNLSVKDNIRHGKLDATDEQLHAAARAAEIHDVITSLPNGYDTIVGERGDLLSGGQRQRIAIARALVGAPPLLILDEPTSALDPLTEASINESIKLLASNRTIVMVTHRLASVQWFDRIFVFDGGLIVEQGSHAQLFQNKGVYRSLWDKQGGFAIAHGRVATVEPDRLKAIPIFATLGGETLKRLASLFQTERFDTGAVPIHEGDAADQFYLVVRGCIEGAKRRPDGTERTIFTLRDGDFFGEIALLQRVPRTATLRVMTPTICLSLSRHDFEELVASEPAVRLALERVMEERIARNAELTEIRALGSRS